PTDTILLPHPTPFRSHRARRRLCDRLTDDGRLDLLLQARCPPGSSSASGPCGNRLTPDRSPPDRPDSPSLRCLGCLHLQPWRTSQCDPIHPVQCTAADTNSVRTSSALPPPSPRSPTWLAPPPDPSWRSAPAPVQ